MSETNAEGETVEDRQDWMEHVEGQPRASVVLESCTLKPKEGADNV
jgi:hypothetical protein